MNNESQDYGEPFIKRFPVCVCRIHRDSFRNWDDIVDHLINEHKLMFRDRVNAPIRTAERMFGSDALQLRANWLFNNRKS